MTFCKYEQHGGYCGRGNHQLCFLKCPDAEMIEVVEVTHDTDNIKERQDIMPDNNTIPAGGNQTDEKGGV